MWCIPGMLLFYPGGPRAMESFEVARQPRPRYITQQRGRNAESGTLHMVGISRQGTTVSSNLKQDTRQSE